MLRRRWETCISHLRRRSETHALVVSYFEDTRRKIDIGSGKYRGLVSVCRGMPWPAGLPYMPLEVISVLHLLTCISTRTGRCCFTLFYSCFTPALYIIELSFCFTEMYVYLYVRFTPTSLLFCNCCSPVLLKYMYFYTPALLLLYSYFVWAL
jgi:hypothetical protein